MNKLKFICYTQIKEIFRNKRFNLIVLFTLIFSFVFVIIFVGKIVAINETKELSRLKHTQDSVQISTGNQTYAEDISKIVDSLKASVKTNIITKPFTFDFKGKTYRENLSIIDDNIGYFYQLKNFDVEQLAQDKTAISEYISIKYGIGLGDKISVKAEEFEVVAIINSYQFEKRILFSNEANQNLLKEFQTINNQFLLNLNDAESLRQFENLKHNNQNQEITMASLDEVMRASLASLEKFILFIVGFSVLFILLCLVNCLLVFEGKLVNLLNNLAIKKLCGVSSKNIFLSLFFENMLLCIVAMHVSLIIVLLTNRLFPIFFYYNFSLTSYSWSLITIMLMILLYSLFLYRKLSKYKLQNLLKGEV